MRTELTMEELDAVNGGFIIKTAITIVKEVNEYIWDTIKSWF